MKLEGKTRDANVAIFFLMQENNLLQYSFFFLQSIQFIAIS